MLIRPKMQVQKSFRIYEDVERDIALLAKLTDRSQNELANAALEELLQDNKIHFLKVAVSEHFRIQEEIGNEEPEPFEIGGIKVFVSYTDEDEFKVRLITEGEDSTMEFDNFRDYDNYLTSLSIYIDPNAEDTKKYLERRTDYRDFIKVR